MINADRYTPVDEGLIPTGEIVPVAGTPFDFRKPVPIGARIDADDEQLRRAGGYDHNFVLNAGAADGRAPGAVAHLAARVVEPTTGRASRRSTFRFAEPAGFSIHAAATGPDVYDENGFHLWNSTMKWLMSLAGVCLAAAIALTAQRGGGAGSGDGYANNYVAVSLIRLNDNGAWSWFMDPRVIVNEGKLIAGSVRAIGSNQANITDPRWGNVEISVYDLASGKIENTVLHPHLEQDDHDAPAFLVRKDGRYLAVYSKHTKERRMYYRISEPHNPLVWGPAMIAETPGSDAPVQGNNATYANLFRMPNGRIYNFIRAFGHDPNYMYSDDDGNTWTYGGRWLHGKGGYSPYLKYASDGKGTVHFVSTEDHPRNFDNNLYHGYLRDNALYLSNGTKVGPLSTTTEAPIATWDFTKVFAADPDHGAWMGHIKLDRNDPPYVRVSR